MGLAPTKSKDKSTGKTTYTFSLCLPELLGLLTLTVLGFTWLFIFGVIVGRGYQPENDIPELNRIMPTKQEAATPLPEKPAIPVANQQKKTSLSLDKKLAQRPVQQPLQAEKNVIKAVQLNFFEQLKGKEAKIVQSAASMPKKATKNSVDSSSALTKALTKPTANAPKRVSKKNAEKFEYIFQIAASTKNTAASKLRNAIQAKGFTTSLAPVVLNSTQWYRINVHFIGTPTALSIFKSKLAVAGYKNPLLRRKTKR